MRREEKLKAITIKEFDKVAESFDNDNPSVYNTCKYDYEELLKEVTKEKFKDYLDAGCGTGALIHLIQCSYPERNYTGIDLSRKMIEVAKKRKMKQAVFIHGDCEALPFEDNTFDVITCSMSFHHYPNPEKFLTNCMRVLRVDGRLIIREIAPQSNLLRWLFNHIEMPLLNRFATKGDVKCYGLEELRDMVKAVGFQPMVVEHRKKMRLHVVCRKIE